MLTIRREAWYLPAWSCRFVFVHFPPGRASSLARSPASESPPERSGLTGSLPGVPCRIGGASFARGEDRLSLEGLEPHRLVVCPLEADCRAPFELVDHLFDAGALYYPAGELLAGIVGLRPSTVPLEARQICVYFFFVFRRFGGERDQGVLP